MVLILSDPYRCGNESRALCGRVDRTLRFIQRLGVFSPNAILTLTTVGELGLVPSWQSQVHYNLRYGALCFKMSRFKSRVPRNKPFNLKKRPVIAFNFKVIADTV